MVSDTTENQETEGQAIIHPFFQYKQNICGCDKAGYFYLRHILYMAYRGQV